MHREGPDFYLGLGSYPELTVRTNPACLSPSILQTYSDWVLIVAEMA